jgi:DNA gyrase subunit A
MLHRGGKGVKCHNISEKTGKLAAIASVEDQDDLMMITNEGTIIRIPIDGIPIYSRSAGGVIVMRLAEGSSIVNIARIAYEEPKEEGTQESIEETSSETSASETQSETVKENSEDENS